MVYLAHFDTPFKHCQHYIGWTSDENFEARMKCHKANKGSKLLAALNKAGIGWNIVRTWPNEDGNFERKLKKQRNAHKHCPVCKVSRIKLRSKQHKKQ